METKRADVVSADYKMPARAAVASPAELKSCCAALYESDWARILLGESLHPGGLALTERLGQALELQPDMTVLDAASGTGASAIFLAERFGCRVVGVDYSTRMVTEARVRAEERGVGSRVEFLQGDIESLRLGDDSFDAIICECAFCTFPDKDAAAREFFRVLKKGGRIGVSDLTRNGVLAPQLDTLLAWVACVADARPAEDYKAFLTNAGLSVETTENHTAALRAVVEDAHLKLMGTEILQKLGKIALPVGVDLEEAKALARTASVAVRDGTLGYVMIVARKSLRRSFEEGGDKLDRVME